MPRSTEQLREDALAIWMAGVAGVAVDRLIRNQFRLSSDQKTLQLAGVSYPLKNIRRLVVVGGGKASGRMAEAFESVLLPLLQGQGQPGVPEILGWINVPDDCVLPLQRIRLHPSRPMGVNEPTEAAAFGTQRIIEILRSLEPDDLCINLLSGGGSALLPAPPPEIPLSEKLEITRFLSGAGADIQELNAVRKQISLLKGGKMKEICRGRRLISLILSDVLGDPLDVIASGPTIDNQGDVPEALRILQRFEGVPASETQQTAIRNVVRFLRQQNDRERIAMTQAASAIADESGAVFDTEGGWVRNVIIGNNALAVDAAGIEAERRGYSAVSISATKSEGFAEDVGVRLAEQAVVMKTGGPDCLISGGEPVVRLAPQEIRGKGGRNQQLVLAALIRLLNDPRFQHSGSWGIALISGGTDGEDGPTDAAGARLDDEVVQRLRHRLQNDSTFDPQRFLETNDAYTFFQAFDGLITTGPTGTNVCDLRVVLVDRVNA